MEKIILDIPSNKNKVFYQCVNYNCERILTRIYKVKENSRLFTVPCNIPYILHKPYLYYTIYWTNFYEKKTN